MTREKPRRSTWNSASRSLKRASGAKPFTAGIRRRRSIPTYFAAFNNLAVAYEHEGEFEKARKAYERALELEPENQMVRQNYELLKEINDRTSRRGSR